jgi:hypothetical protein
MSHTSLCFSSLLPHSCFLVDQQARKALPRGCSGNGLGKWVCLGEGVSGCKPVYPSVAHSSENPPFISLSALSQPCFGGYLAQIHISLPTSLSFILVSPAGGIARISESQGSLGRGEVGRHSEWSDTETLKLQVPAFGSAKSLSGSYLFQRTGCQIPGPEIQESKERASQGCPIPAATPGMTVTVQAGPQPPFTSAQRTSQLAQGLSLTLVPDPSRPSSCLQSLPTAWPWPCTCPCLKMTTML